MTDDIFFKKCQKEWRRLKREWRKFKVEWRKLRKDPNWYKIQNALNIKETIEETTWLQDLAFLHTAVEKNLLIISSFKESNQQPGLFQNLRQRFLKSDHVKKIEKWSNLLNEIEAKSGLDSYKARFILTETTIKALQQALEKNPGNTFLRSELKKATNNLELHIAIDNSGLHNKLYKVIFALDPLNRTRSRTKILQEAVDRYPDDLVVKRQYESNKTFDALDDHDSPLYTDLREAINSLKNYVDNEISLPSDLREAINTLNYNNISDNPKLNKIISGLKEHISDSDKNCPWRQLQMDSQKWLQDFDHKNKGPFDRKIRFLNLQKDFKTVQAAVSQTSDPYVKFLLSRHVDEKPANDLYGEFKQEIKHTRQFEYDNNNFYYTDILDVIIDNDGKFADDITRPEQIVFALTPQEDFPPGFYNPEFFSLTCSDIAELSTLKQEDNSKLGKFFNLYQYLSDRAEKKVIAPILNKMKIDKTLKNIEQISIYHGQVANIKKEYKKYKEDQPSPPDNETAEQKKTRLAEEKSAVQEAEKLWQDAYKFHQLKEKHQGVAALLKLDPTHFTWYQEAANLLKANIISLSRTYGDANLNAGVGRTSDHLGKTFYYSSYFLWRPEWEYVIENDLPQHVQYNLPDSISDKKAPSEGQMAFQQTQQRIERHLSYEASDPNNELDIPYQRIRSHFTIRLGLRPKAVRHSFKSEISHTVFFATEYLAYYKLNTVFKKIFLQDIGFTSQFKAKLLKEEVDYVFQKAATEHDKDITTSLSQSNLRDIVFLQNHVLQDIKSSYLTQQTANFPSYNFDEDLQLFQKLFSENNNYNDNYFLYCILDKYCDHIDKFGTKDQKIKLATRLNEVQHQHDFKLFDLEETWNRKFYKRLPETISANDSLASIKVDRYNADLLYLNDSAKKLIDGSSPLFLAERKSFLKRVEKIPKTKQETSPNQYTRWHNFMGWYHQSYMGFNITDNIIPYPQILEHMEEWQQHLITPSQGLEKVKQLLHQNVGGVELEAALEEAGLKPEARLKLQTKITELQQQGKKADDIFKLIKKEFKKDSHSQPPQSNIGGFVPDQTAKRFTIHKPGSGFTTNNKRRFYSFESKIFDPSKQPILIGDRYRFNPSQPSMRVDKPGLQWSEQDIKKHGAVVVFMPSATWSSPNPQTLYPSSQQNFEVKQPDRANTITSPPIEFTPKVPNEQTQQIQASKTVELLPFYLVSQQTVQASQQAARNQGQAISLSFGQSAFRKAAGDDVSYTGSSRHPTFTTKGTPPQGNLVSFSQIVASQTKAIPRGMRWYTKGATLYSGGSQVTAGAVVYMVAQAAGETPRASENWSFVGAGIANTVVTWGKSLNDISLPVLSTMYLSTRATVGHALAQITHVMQTTATHVVKGAGSTLKTTGLMVVSTSLEATAPVIIIPATIGLGMFAVSRIPLKQTTNRDQFYTLTRAGVLTLDQAHALLGDNDKPYIILTKDTLYSIGLADFLNKELSLGQGGKVFHMTKNGKITTLLTAVPISAPKIMLLQNQTSALVEKK